MFGVCSGSTTERCRRGCLLRVILFLSVALQTFGGQGCDGESWAALRDAMWEAVDARVLPGGVASKLRATLASQEGNLCPDAAASALAILAADSGDKQQLSEALSELQKGLTTGGSDVLAEILRKDFPVFGALDWLVGQLPGSEELRGCTDSHSKAYRKLLAHHARRDGQQSPLPPPLVSALQYLQESTECSPGRASALVSLALGQAPAGTSGKLEEDLLGLLDRVDGLISEEGDHAMAALSRWSRGWPIAGLLHQLGRNVRPHRTEQASSGDCLIIIYAWPTTEIKVDTAEALKSLEKYYFSALGVTHPLVVFTDPGTALTLEQDLGAFTSAKIVPAVIPESELKRHMLSYSCKGGIDCVAGDGPSSDAHRGVVNATQFWSPSYLRISRYTAGPLFKHPALDSCSHFLKIDTDFFFTTPLERDPLEEMRLEGTRLGYWQIHVQGQRQEGYMDAAVAFLEERKLPIRNKAFYARGRFEEKAKRLGIPLSEVPEALEAATVVYGCLFGGDVRFFREPLYQEFFEHMDALQGFENHGWSNQFFLGTAAAAFLAPSQVRRLYIPGRHQESQIGVAGGNVTDYQNGSAAGMLR